MFDATGDAQVPHYSPIGAGANVPQLDLTSVAVNQQTSNTIRLRMTLNSLSSLLPPAGKADAFWIMRFQALSRDDTNATDVYRVFYVGPSRLVGPRRSSLQAVRPGTVRRLVAPPTTPGTCKVVQYPAKSRV